MPLTLGEVMALDALREAEAELLGRPPHRERVVTWAHSSEIYEIAPLLSGGELLLTTGLGLAGADAGARRHWVRDVASRGVAAVALEPGRSLDGVPEEIADEARRSDLPLLVLHRVVPFVRICREVNMRVVSEEVVRLRRSDALVRSLQEAVQAGHGLSSVVGEAAERTGLAMVLATLSGQVVAAAGTGQGSRSRPRTERVVAHGARAVVRAGGREWGHLFAGDDAADEDAAFLAERVAGVVGLLLDRSGASGPSTDVARELLADLLDGRTEQVAHGEREVLVRAGLAGFHPGPDERVVGLWAGAPDLGRTAAALSRALGGVPQLIAPVRGQVLGLLPAGPAADAAGDVAGRLTEAAVRTAASVVVGPPVPLSRAGHSLREAVAAGAVGDGRPGAVPSRRAALPRLLAAAPPAEVRSLTEDALGPLVAWDRRHGTDLVGTLATYLRHGSSATRTARALRLRRQSLHQRLARIEHLLGHRLDEPAELEYLVTATAAHLLTPRDTSYGSSRTANGSGK